jgi:hypothetical protein
MTDTVDTAAPASAETVAPASTASPTKTAPPAEQPKAWALPEAHKTKPWASKVKTEDDLYKQIDNLDSLVGKKHAVPDFKTAKPEDIEAFYSQLRPAEKTAYQFGEGADQEFVGTFQESFYKNGISENQAKALVADYQKLEAAKIEAMTSADGFEAEMTKSFGDKYDTHVSAVVAEHKQHLSPEDQALMDKIPNAYLGVVYRLTSAMQKAYGANETGAQVGAGAGKASPVDPLAQRKALRAEINSIKDRPHTAQELQAKIDALQKTYEGK